MVEYYYLCQELHSFWLAWQFYCSPSSSLSTNPKNLAGTTIIIIEIGKSAKSLITFSAQMCYVRKRISKTIFIKGEMQWICLRLPIGALFCSFCGLDWRRLSLRLIKVFSRHWEASSLWQQHLPQSSTAVDKVVIQKTSYISYKVFTCKIFLNH